MQSDYDNIQLESQEEMNTDEANDEAKQNTEQHKASIPSMIISN